MVREHERVGDHVRLEVGFDDGMVRMVAAGHASLAPLVAGGVARADPAPTA